MGFIFLIISGVVIGLIAAVPIGPVNLICIRRTLQVGPWYGFLSGLGAAFGDGLFASFTGFGLTAVQQLVAGFSIPLQLIGGLLLLSFGIRTFMTPPPSRFDDKLAVPEKGAATVARAMASTFTLTISNPATLFGFTSLFAGLSGLAGDNPSFVAAAFVILGVFVGSATWWLTLTTVVGLLHARIDDHIVRLINEVSGAAVTLFGVGVLVHLGVWFFSR